MSLQNSANSLFLPQCSSKLCFKHALSMSVSRPKWLEMRMDNAYLQSGFLQERTQAASKAQAEGLLMRRHALDEQRYRACVIPHSRGTYAQNAHLCIIIKTGR
jgi:hypothetical protein